MDNIRLWIVCIVLCCASLGLAQQLPFGHYTIEDGLVDSVIMVIYQDSDGFLWFGTRAGLNRFDGLEFKTYTVADGLCHNVIRDLYEAEDGTLWIATERGLGRAVDGTMDCVLPEEELPHHSVRCLAGGSDGEIWFGTYGGGLCRFDGSELRVFTTEDGLPHNKIRSLARGAQDDLWVGTSGGGLSRYRDGRFDTFGRNEGLGHSEIRTILAESDGSLIVGTRSGLFRYSGHRFEALVETGELADEAFNVAIRDREGRLWMGTRQAGAASLGSGRFHRYLTKDGLADDSVMAIYDDDEGNLWFGTYGGGLNRLSTESIVNYQIQEGFQYANVYCLTEDPEGNLWFGTNGGGVSRLRDGVFKTFTTEDGLGHDKVITAMVDSRGRPWFGTLEGASCFENGRFTTIYKADGLAHNIVYDIHEDQHGRMWFGTFEGLTKLEDGVFTSFTTVDGLPDPRVNVILEVGDGFWLGTADGLSHFVDGYFENYSVEEGLGSEFVNVIFPDQEDGLWIGTNGGLSHFENGAFVNYTTRDGLSHNSCTDILRAEDGALWIGTSRGVNRFDGSSFSVVTSKEGLVSDLVNRGGGFKDHEGNLWFGTNGGVSRIDASYEAPKAEAPPVHLETVRVFDEKVGLDSDLILDYDQNYLKFEYVGINFRRPKDVVYRYRLQGLDVDWQQSRQRSVQYTSLPPGDYRFEVTARGSVGGWNTEIADFSFTIVPPFWQRPLFVACMIALVFGAVAYRVWSLKRRTVVLEEKVRERTAEVEEMNEELRWLALNDRLTNLRNRHYVYEIMPEEMSRLDRRLVELSQSGIVNPDCSRLGIALVDLDKFKQVNDSYDHVVGDTVLSEVARRFSEVTRDSDVVARWGGEEFLILYRDVNAAQLGTMADRLLEALQSEPFSIGGGLEIQQTCSVGYTYFPGHVTRSCYSWEDIVRIADVALLEAKRRGRNRAIGLGYERSFPGDEMMAKILVDVHSAVDRGLMYFLGDNDSSDPEAS